MTIDYNKLWVKLKAEIKEKNSWGKNMLLEKMDELEIEAINIDSK